MNAADQLVTSLTARIARDGPVSVAAYMAMVAEAYYARGEAIGADGDFITAPEISQIFGEIVGLWCVVAWQRMGAPSSFLLAECGPGRGTLMADTLRAARRHPDFIAAARLHLVERSGALRTIQRRALDGHPVAWHDRIDDLPDGPMVLVANEFLDALPIHQFVRTDTGWAERHVAADRAGQLAFVDLPAAALVPEALATSARPGDIFEVSPARCDVTTEVAARLVRQRGMALFIDYGHGASALGDTLQTVRRHAYHPVLADPGLADITSQVDFAAIATAARSVGARIFGPIAQGAWLKRCGAEARTMRLMESAAERRGEIGRAFLRLTDPAAMGLMYKVLAVTDPSLASLDGFDQDAAP